MKNSILNIASELMEERNTPSDVIFNRVWKNGFLSKILFGGKRQNRESTISNLKKNGYSDSEISQIEKEYAKIYKEGAKKIGLPISDIPENFGGISYHLGINSSKEKELDKYIEDALKKNINKSFEDKFANLWWLSYEQSKEYSESDELYKKNIRNLLDYFDAKPITVNDLKKIWKTQDFWSRVLAVPNEALYEFIIKEYNKEIQRIKDQTYRFKK